MAFNLHREKVLSLDPLLYYRLDETSGTAVTDASGNGIDGTYNNTPTLGETGLIADTSGAVTFTAANSEDIAVDADTSLDFTGAFSVEAIVEFNSVGAHRPIASKFGAAADRAWVFFYHDTLGELRFFLDDGAGSTVGVTADISATSHTDYTDGFFHVVAVFDPGAAVQIYIDGDLNAEETSGVISAMQATTQGVDIASYYSSVPIFYFDGKLDEIAIYDVALSAADIEELYDLTVASRNPPVINLPFTAVAPGPEDSILLDLLLAAVAPDPPIISLPALALPLAAETFTPLIHAPTLDLPFAAESFTPAIATQAPEALALPLAVQPFSWIRQPVAAADLQIVTRALLRADGFDDLSLQISSFQGRLKDAEPTYLSAVIPNALNIVSDLGDRQNGELHILRGYRFADGSEQLETIGIVDIERIRVDRGVRSASASVDGHRTVAAQGPKTREVPVGNYFAQEGGVKRHRGPVDLFLRPGDTAVLFDGSTLVVRVVNFTVGATIDTMEISD